MGLSKKSISFRPESPRSGCLASAVKRAGNPSESTGSLLRTRRKRTKNALKFSVRRRHITTLTAAESNLDEHRPPDPPCRCPGLRAPRAPAGSLVVLALTPTTVPPLCVIESTRKQEPIVGLSNWLSADHTQFDRLRFDHRSTRS